MKAVVVGAGIGGVSCALALRDAGFDVEVFERAGALREIGAGLTLWSNALRSLDRLGLRDAVRAASSEIDALESRSWKGRLLQRVPIRRLSERFGQPSVGIHRQDLLQVLSAALGKDRVRVGMQCVGVVSTPTEAIVRFADGTEAHGDVLVGADGLFSAVRGSIYGDEPTYAGHVCWRGVTARGPHWTIGRDVSWFGPGRHFGTVVIPDGRIFWYATQNQPLDRPPPEDVLAEVRDAFAGWADPIPDLLRATAATEIVRNRLYDRPVAWGAMRVTLIGDAAHPMRPTLGQGACQAIEDAVALGNALRIGGDPERALRRFEGSRAPRVRRVVRHSRALSAFEQLGAPMTSTLRNAAIRMSPGRASLPWFASFLRPERSTSRG
jgi:2-polyprenyl-6-methoxyphenol hydroxylase-like FAD-dependent oxidoreductase